MQAGLRVTPFMQVLDDFRAGRPVVLVDDADRENEGDLIVATQFITTEIMALMLREARGLVCVALDAEISNRLNLPLQVNNNSSRFGTPFTVSVDHASVLAKGVTASARVETMRRMLAADAKPEDFICPGHVFPLIANPAGVIARRGQTEGSVDLARLSGLHHSAVICEILNQDGTLARAEQLNGFAAKHGFSITTVDEILKYRIANEILLEEIAYAPKTTDYGDFDTYVFQDTVEAKEHLVLVRGGTSFADKIPVVRVHSECLTGDVFGSLRCDCGQQLEMAMRLIAECGCGILIYLRQEGRGIGLGNKLRAYELQDQGYDTVEANVKLGFPADLRDYAVAAKILERFDARRINLLTNNPRKLEALRLFGIDIAEHRAIRIPPTEFSRHYLETKKAKMGHLL